MLFEELDDADTENVVRKKKLKVRKAGGVVIVKVFNM